MGIIWMNPKVPCKYRKSQLLMTGFWLTHKNQQLEMAKVQQQ